jgi:hypothetical protein
MLNGATYLFYFRLESGLVRPRAAKILLELFLPRGAQVRFLNGAIRVIKCDRLCVLCVLHITQRSEVEKARSVFDGVAAHRLQSECVHPRLRQVPQFPAGCRPY